MQFFFPIDTLVLEYIEMIKSKVILLEDVPHYLNLHDCVEKELIRQGFNYYVSKNKHGVSKDSFFD